MVENLKYQLEFVISQSGTFYDTENCGTRLCLKLPASLIKRSLFQGRVGYMQPTQETREVPFVGHLGDLAKAKTFLTY